MKKIVSSIIVCLTIFCAIFFYSKDHFLRRSEESEVTIVLKNLKTVIDLWKNNFKDEKVDFNKAGYIPDCEAYSIKYKDNQNTFLISITKKGSESTFVIDKKGDVSSGELHGSGVIDICSIIDN